MIVKGKVKTDQRYPLVSILIPNYNYETTIAETIESAIHQSYPNLEIIVLDNRSTDDSYQVAKRYRKYGVQVYRTARNLGVHSHNTLLTMACGDYIHVLHSDDMVLPTFIEECVALMEHHPNVGFTVTERTEIDAAGEDLGTALPFYNCSCIIPGDSQQGVLAMASYYVPSETVFRREIMEKAGLYEVNITNFLDWWMLYKCSCISDMGCIHKPLCKYRMWPSSQTNFMTKEMLMPMQGYLQRTSMLETARYFQEESVLRRESEMFLKQADLTLKLGVDVIREGLLETGKKYLELAQAFSPEIAEGKLYRALETYLYDEALCGKENIDAYLEKKNLLGRRDKSYDPPEGYKKYKEEK